jgi:hypothetical protein
VLLEPALGHSNSSSTLNLIQTLLLYLFRLFVLGAIGPYVQLTKTIGVLARKIKTSQEIRDVVLHNKSKDKYRRCRFVCVQKISDLH